MSKTQHTTPPADQPPADQPPAASPAAASSAASAARAPKPLLGQDKDPFAGVEFPIGVAQACRIANVTESQLKHYDKKGFLVPRRTGEGVANNRKLYTRQDMERLMGLLVLQAYGFGLAQAAELLDSGQADGEAGYVASFDAVMEKMAEVRREQNRLRDLALFVKYVEASQLPLATGLACGPADIEAAADWVRGCPAYVTAMEGLDRVLEEPRARVVGGEADAGAADNDHVEDHVDDHDAGDDFDHDDRTAFELLCAILVEMSYANADSLAQQGEYLGLLAAWWNANVAPLESGGFLNFYASLEDHEAAYALIEAVDESAPGNLQMWLCFAFLVDLIVEAAPFVKLVAAESQHDVVRALAAVDLLIPLMEGAFVGETELCHEASEEIVEMGLRRMEHLLSDPGLLMLLGWSDEDFPTKEEMAATRQMVRLFFEQRAQAGQEDA